MKNRLWLLFLLLAIAGLWIWAQFWPRPPPALSEAYRGVYVLFRFEPPPDMGMPNPYPAGQENRFTFREDGTYSIQVMLSEGYEMIRWEGTVEADEKGRLTLTQISENRREGPPYTQVFQAGWGQDKAGRYLLLTGTPHPYEFYLRPVPDPNDAE